MKYKFCVYLFLTIVIGMVTWFSGCGDQYSKLKIVVSTSELTFDLDNDDASEYEATFTATVDGASKDMVSGLILELSDQTVASASVISAENNKYTIKVIAKGAGETTLTIKTKESAKVCYEGFKIIVSKTAESLSSVTQKFSIKRGDELKLSLDEMLRVYPERIYPAIATFSILPTPSEVRADEELSVLERETIAALWDEQYGDSRLLGLSVKDNVLIASPECDVGVLQILAEVNGLYSTFPVLVYEKIESIQIYEVERDEFNNWVALAEDPTLNVHLATNASVAKKYAVVLDNQLNTTQFRVDEIFDETNKLTIAQLEELEIRGKTYTCFSVGGFNGGETVLRINVDLLYVNDNEQAEVFTTIQKDFPVKIDTAVSGIDLKCSDGVFDEINQVYNIQSAYAANLLGEKFTVELSPKAATDPSFSLGVASDMQGLVSVYVSTDDFVEKPSGKAETVKYDWQASSAIRLRGNSVIYIKYEGNENAAKNFDITIFAGFANECEATFSFKVVDAVKSLSVSSDDIKLVLGNDISQADGGMLLTVSAATTQVDTVLKISSSVDVVNIKESTEYGRTPSNGVLTINYEITAKAEGRTVIEISSLSGYSCRIVCNCYLAVDKSIAKLYVQDQTKNNIINVDSATLIGNELNLSMRKGKTIDIGYQMFENYYDESFKEHSYYFENISVSKEIESDVYEETFGYISVDSSEIITKHSFKLTPNQAAENQKFKIELTIGFVKKSGNTWSEDSVTLKILLDVISPIKDMSWARVIDSEPATFECIGQYNTATLYPKNEIYRDDESYHAEFYFAYDSLIDTDIGVEYSIDLDSNELAYAIDLENVLSNSQSLLNCTKLTLTFLKWPEDNTQQALDLKITIVTMKFREIKQLSCYVSLKHPLKVNELKLAGAKKHAVIFGEDDSEIYQERDMELNSSNMTTAGNETTYSFAINKLAGAERFDEIELLINVSPLNALNTQYGMYVKNSINGQFNPPIKDYFKFENNRIIYQKIDDKDFTGLVTIYIYPLDHEVDGVEVNDQIIRNGTDLENPTPWPFIKIELSICNGSQGNPYQIYDANDFLDIYSLSNSRVPNRLHRYVLKNNIDLSKLYMEKSELTQNRLAQIGSFFEFQDILESESKNGFSQRYAVSGIRLNKVVSDEDNKNYVGLFSILSGSITNVNFNVDMDFATESTINVDYLGLLAGKVKNKLGDYENYTDYKNISGVKVQGSLLDIKIGGVNTDLIYIGGVAGLVDNNVEIERLKFSGIIDLNLAANGRVGGMFGKSNSSIDNISNNTEFSQQSIELNVYASPNTLTDVAIGGLVGEFAGAMISNVGVAGKVYAPTLDRVGGVVGFNDGGNLVNIKTTANVVGHSNVGGVVGYNSNSGVLTAVYAENYVSDTMFEYALARGYSNIGGIIGYSEGGEISYSYVQTFAYRMFKKLSISTQADYVGDVWGTVNVGGLVGFAQDITILSCFANINIQLNWIGDDPKNLGGLIGCCEGGKIQHAYANCRTFKGGNSSNVGQLIGKLSGYVQTEGFVNVLGSEIKDVYGYVFEENINVLVGRDLSWVGEIILTYTADDDEITIPHSFDMVDYYFVSEEAIENIVGITNRNHEELQNINLRYRLPVEHDEGDVEKWLEGVDDENDYLPRLTKEDGSQLNPPPVESLTITPKIIENIPEDEDVTTAGVSVFDNGGPIGLIIDLAYRDGEDNGILLGQIAEIKIEKLGASTEVDITSSNPSVVSLILDENEHNYNFESNRILPKAIGASTITVVSRATPSIKAMLYINVICSSGFGVKKNAEDIVGISIINDGSENISSYNYNVRINESQVLQGYYLNNGSYEQNNNVEYGYIVDDDETILSATQNYTINVDETKIVGVKAYWVLDFGGEKFISEFSSDIIFFTFNPYYPIQNFDVSCTDATPSSGESTRFVARVEAEYVGDINISYSVTGDHVEYIDKVQVLVVDSSTPSKYKELRVEVYLNDEYKAISSPLEYKFTFKATTQYEAESSEKDIDISFLPTNVNKVNLSFYTKGLEMLEKGEEMPSLSISTTEMGVLMIEVVQDYADFDYCVIYPLVSDGDVSIQQLVKKYDENLLPQIHNLETTYIDGGVFIGKYSELIGVNFAPFSGVMYARVLIGGKFVEGDTCPIQVKLFKNGNIEVASAQIVLVTDFVSHATLTLDQSTQSSYIDNTVGLGTQARLVLNGEFRNCVLNRLDILDNAGSSILATGLENALDKCYISFKNLNNLGSAGREVVNRELWLYVGPGISESVTYITVVLNYTQQSVADKLPYSLIVKLKLYLVAYQVISATVTNLDNGALVVQTQTPADLIAMLNCLEPDYEVYKNYVATPVAQNDFNEAVEVIKAKLKTAESQLNICYNGILIWEYKPFNGNYTKINLPTQGNKINYGDFYIQMRNGDSNEYLNYVIEGINTVSDLSFKLRFKFGYSEQVLVRIKDGDTESGLVNNQAKEIDFEFKVNIIGGTVINTHPTPISSASEFRSIVNGGSYILSRDIDLGSDWEPLDLVTQNGNSLTLDGNGFIIKVSGFKVDDNKNNIGVFSTIGSNVVLTNLIIDVDINVIDLQQHSSINFGFLAGSNQGIIYNCDVLTTSLGEVTVINGAKEEAMAASTNDEFNNQNQTAEQLLVETNPTKYSVYIVVSKNTISNMGGFVGVNDGYITNCRVGRLTENSTKLKGTDKQVTQGINIFGYGNLGGFVGVNNRTISNSYYKNGDIINYARSSATTGGFVARNSGSGLIFGCFVEGRRADGSRQPRCEYGGVRAVVGTVGGFVHNNSGKIENSYSNIRLIGASIYVGGFVYNNFTTSRIANCYTACEVDESNVSTGVFIGRDRTGRIMQENGAEITNSYYYTDQLVASNPQKEYVTPVDLKGWSDRTGKSFTGFVFGQNGVNCVWQFDNLHSSFGPQLSFADTIYYSHRDITNNYAYSVGEGLGTRYNPILITSFNEENSYSSWASVFENNAIIGADNSRKVPNGVYISLLRDITFVGREEYTHSFKTDFSGVLYGNGYTLSGLSYNSSENVDNFGLFKTIDSGQVHSFNISVGNYISAADNFGVLAGTIKGNSFIDNVKIYEGILNGRQNIGGLAAIIEGNSFVQYVVVQNISINASEVPNVGEYYVGGVAGKIDLDESTANSIDNSPRIYSLIAQGDINLTGYVVGGVVGYIGSNTETDNIALYVEQFANSKLKSNGDYVGGIVGRLEGTLSSAYLGASIISQKQLDENGTYVGYLGLFTDNTSSAGGLVGILNGGTLQYSYSRAGVEANTAANKYKGSIIGEAISGYINEIYTISTLDVIGNIISCVEEKVVLISNSAILDIDSPDYVFKDFNAKKWVLENGKFPTLINNYVFNVVIPEDPGEIDEKTYLDNVIAAILSADSHTTISLERDITITVSDGQYIDPDSSEVVSGKVWASIEDGVIKLSKYQYTPLSNLKDSSQKVLSGGLEGRVEDNGTIRNAKITFVGLDDSYNSFFGELNNFSILNVDFEFQFVSNTNISTNSFGLLASKASACTFENMSVEFSNLSSIEQENHSIFNVGMIVPEASNSVFCNVNIVGQTDLIIFDDTYVNIGGLVGKNTNEGYSLTFSIIDVSNLRLSVTNAGGSGTSSNLQVSLGGIIGYSSEMVLIEECNAISNLTCTLGNYRNTSEVYIGGMIGYTGVENSYIKEYFTQASVPNIIVSIDSTNPTLYVGGLAGWFAGEVLENRVASEIIITSTLSNPTDMVVGGISGYISNTYRRSVIPVQNNSYSGSIHIVGNGAISCGGIFGQYDMKFNADNSNTECTMLYNTTFSGSISITDGGNNAVSTYVANTYVGGILGQSNTIISSQGIKFDLFKVTNAIIEDSANIAINYSTASNDITVYVGGLAGKTDSMLYYNTSKASINVVRNSADDEKTFIGGLVGDMQNSSHQDNEVIYSVNVSNVSTLNIKVMFAKLIDSADVLGNVTSIEFIQYNYSYTLDPKNKLSINELGLNNYFVTDNLSVYLYENKTKLLFVGEGKIIAKENLNNLFVRIIPKIEQIQSIKTEQLDTSEVTSMASMFYGCSGLTYLDISNLNVAKVTSMSKLFAYCGNLTNIKFGNNFGIKATNMSYMFYRCSSLQNLDLSNFSTDKVTNMSYLFAYCSSLSRVYLSSSSGWTTTRVSNSSDMFKGCSALVGYYKDEENYEYTTTYSSSHVNKDYAKIRTQTEEGYFTSLLFK